MIEKEDICIWSPHEPIYSFGEISHVAFYILDGNAEIFDKQGLKLGRIGVKEIFGETSLILNTKRTVTAVAGAGGLKARKIPRSFILKLSEKEPVLFALWQKTQHRLIDSNHQSAALASELEKITSQLELQIKSMFEINAESAELEEHIKEIRTKIDVFRSALKINESEIME